MLVYVTSPEILSVAYKDNVLLFAEVFGGRNMFALSANDGKMLWTKVVGYDYFRRRRPLIVGNTVYTDDYGFDLHTGKARERVNPVTGMPETWRYRRAYGCGGTTASANDLFFRSGVISYFDLHNDQGITNFGAVRPGCWLNIVPAGGVVQAPMSRFCTCSFPIKTTVVFHPTDRHRAWSYIKIREMKPVKHLAINLGAPGDRRDPEGLL